MEYLIIQHEEFFVKMYRVITGIPTKDYYVIRVYEEPEKGYSYKSKIKTADGYWGEVGPQKPAMARDILSKVFPEFPGFTSQPGHREVSIEKVSKALEAYILALYLFINY